MTLGVTEKRSATTWIVPVLLAVVVLAALGAFFYKSYIHPGLVGHIDSVQLFPVHTEYKRPYGAVGDTQTEDALYVIPRVTVQNTGDLPLFIKDITASITTEDGTEVETGAIYKDDLPRLQAIFPKMQPMLTGLPLLRESTIPKGAAGTGFVIVSWNIPPSVWEKRKAAEVRVDFYHHDRLTLPLPK